GGVAYGEGLAGLYGGDRIDLPALQQRTLHAAATFSQRQLVAGQKGPTHAQIDVRIPTVQPPVARQHREGAYVVGAAAPALVVVDHVPPGVIADEVESITEAVLERGLQRVIVRGSGRIHHRDGRYTGKQVIVSAARLDITWSRWR